MGQAYDMAQQGPIIALLADLPALEVVEVVPCH
jgi:hypothetical protein